MFECDLFNGVSGFLKRQAFQGMRVNIDTTDSAYIRYTTNTKIC